MFPHKRLNNLSLFQDDQCRLERKATVSFCNSLIMYVHPCTFKKCWVKVKPRKIRFTNLVAQFRDRCAVLRDKQSNTNSVLNEQTFFTVNRTRPTFWIMIECRYMYYTYVLYCKEKKSFYYGFTQDLRRRIKEHSVNKKPYSYTQKQTIKLVYYEAYCNEDDAKAREKFFKSGWGRNYIKKILKNYLKEKGSIQKVGRG